MKRKLLLVIILFISIFMITGCNKDIVGKYKIVEIRENNEVLDFKKIKENKINYTIIVNKDKTALLTINEEEKLKYNDKYFYRENDESDKVAYTFDGKRLILNADGLELIFEKR